MVELAKTSEGQARIAKASERFVRTTYEMSRADAQGEMDAPVPTPLPVPVPMVESTPPAFLELPRGSEDSPAFMEVHRDAESPVAQAVPEDNPRVNIFLKHLSKQSLRTATKSQAAWMSMYLTQLFLVKVVIVVTLLLLLDGFLES